MRRYLLGLFVVVGVLVAAKADAATLTVCPTGCTQTSFQTALDAANPGDTILLNTTGTFTGTFLLPAQKTCVAQDATCIITVRSGVTSTGTIVSTSIYPVANMRISPFQASLATITPSGSNNAAIRTVRVSETGGSCAGSPCVSGWFDLKWLNIVGNTVGGADLLDFGSQNGGADAQDTNAKSPHHIRVYQNLIHGDAITGQFRGVLVAARDSSVTDNDFYDIKSQSEGQAIWIENTIGNVTIENNHVSCGAECIFFGGDIPRMHLDTTVLASPAPTATSLTLAVNVPDWVYVGQGLSFMSGGVLKYSHVTSIAGAALGIESSNGNVPDSPGAVNLSVVQRNTIIRKNHVDRPPSWRDPIVSTPQSVTATGSATGGSLTTPGTYAYRVVARVNTNSLNVARSTSSVEVTATISATGTTGSVLVSWAAVPNAFEYRIYCGSVGGENRRFTVTAPTVTFTDTGAAGTAEAVPTTTGNVWTVKNILEIKKADGVTVEGNVWDYNWLQAQNGQAILFTPANNSVGLNGSDSIAVRNITFQYNLVRHATACFNMTFHDASGDISDSLRDITIRHNVCSDMGTQWGNAGGLAFIQITGTLGAYTTAYPTGYYGPSRIILDHNTFFNDTGNTAAYLFDIYHPTQQPCTDCVFTNNLMRRSSYGVRSYSPSLLNEGSASWTAATAGTSPISNNVISGSSCSLYPGPPAATYCPNEATFQAAFADYANGDYRVTSQFLTMSTTGGPVGADLALITPLTTIALSGDNTGTPPPVAPTITTSTMPDGQIGNVYNTPNGVTLTGTGGTQPYVWTLEAGSTLPAGLTLTTGGKISGTPTTPGGGSFTVRLTGGNAAFATQVLSIVVNDVLPTGPSRADRINEMEFGGFRRDTCPTDTIDLRGTTPGSGAKVRVGDQCFELSTGLLQLVLSTAPTVTLEAVGSNATKLTSGAVPVARLTNVNASNLTSGTVPVARLGDSGTPSATKALMGDGASGTTWAVPAGVVPTVDLTFNATAAQYVTWAVSTTTTELAQVTRNRKLWDLTGYTQCRLYVKWGTAIVGATVAVYPQYSTDGGTNWNDLGASSTPSVDASATTNMQTTAYVSIVAGSKQDVQLRLAATASGTPSTNPQIGNAGLNCK